MRCKQRSLRHYFFVGHKSIDPALFLTPKRREHDCRHFVEATCYSVRGSSTLVSLRCSLKNLHKIALFIRRPTYNSDIFTAANTNADSLFNFTTRVDQLNRETLSFKLRPSLTVRVLHRAIVIFTVDF